MANYSSFLGLGIAGNFALHLAQAGELEDFKNIITKDEAAPKGMFPFYLPKPVSQAKEILNTYPLSSDTIQLTKERLNIQAEPEVGLVCDLIYEENTLVQIVPQVFGAYNDCSIRVAGASKISDKKNWGSNTKGFSDELIAIDKFSQGGVMDNYSIVSFLRRNGELHQYGEDVELHGYSYFYEKLLDWMVNQINTQKDFGPLEHLSQYITACENPKQAIISIGATRYTEYGKHTFLEGGDEVIIALYESSKYTLESLVQTIESNDYDKAKLSVLKQRVIA